MSAETPFWKGWLTKERLLLGLILIVAAVLRFHNLSGVPPGLWCDEVSIGANAASLAATGRSLDGTFLPLYVHEKSFDRYGFTQIVYQPLYQYALVPIVKVFGLSAWSVRLPAVLFALAGIAAAWGLGRFVYGSAIGLATAALLAVSPWHHHYSRFAFEIMALPALVTLGVTLLFRGLQRPRWLVAGAAVLALATYAYPIARLFVPLLTMAFAAVYAAELKASWKATLAALGVAVFVGLPNLYLVLTDPTQGRASQLLVWTQDIRGEAAVQFLDRWTEWSPAAAAIRETRALFIPFVIAFNWLAHYGPDFLFLTGDDNPQFSCRGIGMAYLFELPLLAAGLWSLGRRWHEKTSRFLLLWFLIWPLPACVTLHAPQPTRAAANFPVLEIIAALGARTLLLSAREALVALSHWRWRPVLAGFVVCFIAGSVPLEISAYFRHYHRQYPVYSAPHWTAGIEEGFRTLRRERQDSEEIVVSSKVFNAFLNVFFFGGVEIRPSPDGSVPWPYHIDWADKPETRPKPGLWLIREGEWHPRHRGGIIVARVPYPDGSPNLLILRHVP